MPNPNSTSDFYVVIPEGVIELGPYPLAVYAALRKFADHRSGECWPSHRTIAETAKVSTAQVKRALIDLREEGWVSWDQRRRDDGSLQSNVYAVYGAPRPVIGGEDDPVQVPIVPVPDATTEPQDGGGSAVVRQMKGVGSDSRGVGSDRTGGVGSDRTDPHSGSAIELLLKEPLLIQEQTSRPSDADRLAALMSALLAELGVAHRQTDQWVKDLDRMMRLDGRTAAEVEAAMRWALRDDFWRANIHSPRALRKQYDRMRLQAQRATSGGCGTDLYLQAAASLRGAG